MSDLFYVFGILLTLGALIVAFVGLRAQGFPSSRGALIGVASLFALLVIGTCGYAVVLAREEQEHREHEAEEREVSEEEAVGEHEADTEEEAEADAEAGGEANEPSGGESNTSGEQKLALTSPDDGQLVFEPDALEASAGEVTLEYTNPSAVPHNVAIEANGETVATGDVVTDGGVSVAAFELEPGSYVFYCAVPGHREGGMEGKLTVK